jgi:hypothetical protein
VVKRRRQESKRIARKSLGSGATNATKPRLKEESNLGGAKEGVLAAAK